MHGHILHGPRFAAYVQARNNQARENAIGDCQDQIQRIFNNISEI